MNGWEKEELLKLENINRQYKLFERYLSTKRDRDTDKVDAEEEYKIQINTLKKELAESFLPGYDIDKIIDNADKITDKTSRFEK
jgi:hypothetical protein